MTHRLHAHREPIGILREEHQKLLGRLALLEKLVANRIDWESVRRVHTVLASLVRLLETHTPKEKGVLFPTLQVHLGFDDETIPTMLKEHDEISSLLASLVDGVMSARGGADPRAFETVSIRAQKLINLLREHISKEDNVLFWVAALRLTEVEKNQIALRMRALDPGSLPPAVRHE